jgi:hypothetical protein
MVQCIHDILEGRTDERRHCFELELLEGGSHAAPRAVRHAAGQTYT